MAPAAQPREPDEGVEDSACVAFLQWALPRLRMQWPGFRRVRGQVCKRIQRRLDTIGAADTQQYRAFLEAHPQEWPLLDALCRVTVTRFYRDRQVFEALVQTVLPALARAALQRRSATLRLWCAGCASGEEPYSLSIAWRQALAAQFPGLSIDITATDADAALLARAAQACYAWSAVKNLPPDWRAAAFEAHEDSFCLKPAYAAGVRFVQQDVRNAMPGQSFDLICCRNLAFTYFDNALQVRVAAQLHDHLQPGGVLLLGAREQLPAAPGFEGVSPRLGLYRRAEAGAAEAGA